MNSVSFFNINEGLRLLKLADTVLILINPSPSTVKHNFLKFFKNSIKRTPYFQDPDFSSSTYSDMDKTSNCVTLFHRLKNVNPTLKRPTF